MRRIETARVFLPIWDPKRPKRPKLRLDKQPDAIFWPLSYTPYTAHPAFPRGGHWRKTKVIALTVTRRQT